MEVFHAGGGVEGRGEQVSGDNGGDVSDCDGAVWGGVYLAIAIDGGWAGVGGEFVRGSTDRHIAGDEFLRAVLHPRDAAGVFYLPGHRQWVEVFAEWEEAAGVFVRDWAGAGLCDQRGVGAEPGGDGVGEW